MFITSMLLLMPQGVPSDGHRQHPGEKIARVGGGANSQGDHYYGTWCLLCCKYRALMCLSPEKRDAAIKGLKLLVKWFGGCLVALVVLMRLYVL